MISTKKSNKGFTIVEVMVVLGISGVMFAIAYAFIGGKVEQSTFQTGVNSLATNLQAALDQVNSGEYSDVPLYCSNTSGPYLSFSGGGINDQGKNSGCMFRGKLIHFYSLSGSGQINQYEIVNLADSSQDDTTETTTISPTVTGIPGLTTTSIIPNGLYINTQANSSGSTVGVAVNPVTAGASLYTAQPDYYNLAILQGLGQANGGVGYQSGAQSLELAYSNWSSLTNQLQTFGNASNTLQNIGDGNSTMPILRSLLICVTDGTRYAPIYIGAQTTTGSAENQLTFTVGTIGMKPC